MNTPRDNDEVELAPTSATQRRTLLIVLALNALLAAGLVVVGVIADSSALIANGVDNASDAVVYGLSYLAVTRGLSWKIRAAQISGVALMLFAGAVLIETGRRFFLGESDPSGPAIMAASIVAAIVNVLCLKLLMAHRQTDVNFRSAWTFSMNDMVANLGALVAGALVLWLGRSWPDLVVGMAIAMMAAKGGYDILQDARHERARQP